MSFQERKVIRDRIEADRDRIWRSAALDYQSGERPFLAAEDQEASNQRNKSFELENPFEAAVGHWLRFCNVGDQFTLDDCLPGIDELIRVTAANPGAILLTDSFYASVRGVYGSGQGPSVGGALIDIQSAVGPSLLGYVCTFHAPQDGDAVGSLPSGGHGSAKGPSSR